MIWEEEVTLRDGATVYVRVVQPSDRPRFEEGFAFLSPESRMNRFLAPRQELRKNELDYLTDMDGVDHFAIGAVTRDAEGQEGPVGVARFIRLPDERHVAEFAITVVDDFQRRGVGTMLFDRLITAALKRGITTFRADLLPGNRKAKELIRSLLPRATSRLVGSLVRFDIPLEDEEEHEAPEEA